MWFFFDHENSQNQTLTELFFVYTHTLSLPSTKIHMSSDLTPDLYDILLIRQNFSKCILTFSLEDLLVSVFTMVI